MEEQLLQLDNIADGFGDEGRFESFFQGWVFRFVELSYLAGGSDDKRECPFEEQNYGCNLGEDVGSLGIEDSGFVQDFEIFFHGAVGTF